jgi:hypothetical protein
MRVATPGFDTIMKITGKWAGESCGVTAAPQ